MSSHLYATYLLACLVVTLIPGPSVTLIVANGLKYGTRPAVLNALGGQIGIGVILLTVLVGLTSLIGAMAWLFDWLKIAGAAYLIFIGWKLLRAPIDSEPAIEATRPRGGFILQGLLVMLANPKGLLFFGAFMPQFIDPHGDYQHQALVLGATAMAMGAATDTLYAVLSGRVQNLLSGRRMRLINRAGGTCLIGGGIWLAFTRAR
jgi:homoserine/homoserine lactone efflux protein